MSSLPFSCYLRTRSTQTTIKETLCLQTFPNTFVCNVTPHIHPSMAVTLSEQAAHVYGRLSVSGRLSVFLCVHVTMPPPVVQGTEVK